MLENIKKKGEMLRRRLFFSSEFQFCPNMVVLTAVLYKIVVIITI